MLVISASQHQYVKAKLWSPNSGPVPPLISISAAAMLPAFPAVQLCAQHFHLSSVGQTNEAAIDQKAELANRREMETIATIAMNAGLAVQNYAEWRGGGPSLPSRIADQFGPGFSRKSVRFSALILASAFVAILSAGGLIFNAGWLIAIVSTALIANAVSQLAVSAFYRKIQPGTASGILVMAPSAAWALSSTNNQLGWLVYFLGPALSVPTLVLLWLAARRVAR
ncbi:hypothetical protein [Palleronia caenipelagi]|uniref:Uncharacterized protein n=1 Tax=Palleronia caenipelagi TaxID=2489174 RepID=A0A547PJS6_9RHOB|nr:hypothetical protein [Palleronia caenipelagi]TRD14383.1 hypothetical protein FEV53_19070 [Palleronia caenipelagi]